MPQCAHPYNRSRARRRNSRTPGCPGAPPARWPPPRPTGSSVACSEVRAGGPTPRVLLVAAVLPCTRCAPDGESHREGRVTGQRAHPGCFPGSRGLGAQVPATERSGSRGPEQRAPPSRVSPAWVRPARASPPSLPSAPRGAAQSELVPGAVVTVSGCATRPLVAGRGGAARATGGSIMTNADHDGSFDFNL